MKTKMLMIYVALAMICAFSVTRASEPQLKAKATGAHSVTLNWTQSTGAAAGATCPSGTGSTALTANTVYRGTTSGGESATPLVVLTPPAITYVDATATTAGQAYFYQVTASNCAGESAKSNEVSAIIPNPTVPAAPTGLTGVAQ